MDLKVGRNYLLFKLLNDFVLGLQRLNHIHLFLHLSFLFCLFLFFLSLKISIFFVLKLLLYRLKNNLLILDNVKLFCLFVLDYDLCSLLKRKFRELDSFSKNLTKSLVYTELRTDLHLTHHLWYDFRIFKGEYNPLDSLLPPYFD